MFDMRQALVELIMDVEGNPPVLPTASQPSLGQGVQEIMAEYIEREKLLQDISETVVFTVRKGTPLPNAEMRGANKVIDQVKSAPTVDVVKAVRCKDCEFVQPTQIKLNGKDLKTCELYKRSCFDNDFCSRGVLKECEGK